MLEGEDDAFWFHPKCQTLTANCVKAMPQTKNHELLAH
jgi:hypothetical protein